ncbi:MAG: HEPN domain-containing protein [Deltaproteobacteria bacterium]|jgi:HEPN domain-containing protein|nr:HEPN domain-containing protein [Deltaproteobacteria bacterium]
MIGDKSTYWIEVAEYDMETARAMLESKRFLYVGFMCHQAIEKGFKAVIAKSGIMPPKIHNLDRLSEQGGLSPMLDARQQALLDTLAPLNIESRYPEYKERIAENLSEQTCNDIIAETKDFLSWIKSKL